LIAVAPVLRPSYMLHGPWPWIIKKNARSPAPMCYILIAPMAGCAAPEVADLCAYGRRVMPN
jgi:hypothetical protein